MTYIITNTWTQARHGHAHDELLSIKDLLKSISIDAKILSVDPAFGDFRVRSLGRAFQNLYFDRTRFLKPIVDTSYGIDLRRGIRNSTKGLHLTSKELAITSSRFKHLLKIQDALRLFAEPRIRILDAPSDQKNWRILSEALKRMHGNPVIAMEVKSSVVESQKYFDGAIHVPSHYGMQTESLSINRERDKIGIFWPVGRSFSTNEVVRLLDELRSQNPVVKLPTSMRSGDFKEIYPRIEFVEPGLGIEEFREILSRIKVAVLGYNGYNNQSSGYVGYFMANNVPILVSRTNTFFDEIKEIGRVYDLYDNKKGILGMVTTLMEDSLVLGRNYYSIFVENAWKCFLLDTNDRRN